MKQNLNIRSLVTGAVLSALLILTIAAVQENRSSWEYKTFTQGGASSLDMKAINNLGYDGWEAVGFFSLPPHSQGFLFKRKR